MSNNLTDTDIITEIHMAVEHWEKKIEKIWGNRVAPSITFDLRGRTCGGRAKLMEGAIQYNLDWARANLDEYLNDTVPHELTHHVAYREYNDSGHGRFWKACMRKIGCKPERTTGQFSNAKPARTIKRHIYIASCGCDFPIPTPTHNKIQKGSARICRRHRARIVAEDYYETIILE